MKQFRIIVLGNPTAQLQSFSKGTSYSVIVPVWRSLKSSAWWLSYVDRPKRNCNAWPTENGHRSVRYHLDEWSEGCRAPQDAKEFYNQRHMKTCNVIDRTWGIMKWRWDILRSTTFYPLSTQNRMILGGRRQWYAGRCGLDRNRPKEDVLVQALKELLTGGWKSDNGLRVGYLNGLQDKMMKKFPCTDLHSNPHINARLGEIVSKMGHEHDMTRKCEAIFDIVNHIDEFDRRWQARGY
ncbi:hypothetical protein BUALT_Bualt10G0042700 [Buddleja alternifolia]|uniref:Uncharacterized protein n=1 Tax=Buddleja alternifolia TaxID=168488 RepID=A0AAV6X6Q1_9LAMI|nr:hypothetical protein BUALT_Bualt10G0042700 [Buddleja alternifolia]